MNKKGFTLVELLATVVILSVIILAAVINVVPLMNRSRHKAFINDAIVISQAAANKYADNKLRGTDVGNLTDISMGENKKCYSIADRGTEPNLIKGLIGEYATTANKALSGSVEVCYEGCTYKTKIWITNNVLNINGATDDELKELKKVPNVSYNSNYLTCGR